MMPKAFRMLLPLFLATTFAHEYHAGTGNSWHTDNFPPSQIRRKLEPELETNCGCINPKWPCKRHDGCWGYTDKASCERANGVFCTPKPCTIAGCKSCSSNAEQCFKCENNRIQLSHNTCATFTTAFAGVSDSSFVLSGNLVLFSNKQIADSLSDGFAGIKGSSRAATIRHAIAAFSHRFKDKFDAVVVFPSTRQQKDKGYSTHTTSFHTKWVPDYAGAPKMLRSSIIHNLAGPGRLFPFKHEILHRWGVFNTLIPGNAGDHPNPNPKIPSSRDGFEKHARSP